MESYFQFIKKYVLTQQRTSLMYFFHSLKKHCFVKLWQLSRKQEFNETRNAYILERQTNVCNLH